MLLSCDFMERAVRHFNRTDRAFTVNAIPNRDAAAWLEATVPRFECPDPTIQTAYYFRWWTFRKHLRTTPDGWVITEFLPNVSWAGKYNTIACGAGHHYREGRWLRDPAYLRDYTAFWFRNGGEPRRLATWMIDGLYAFYKTHPDAAWLADLLPELKRHRDELIRLYRDDTGLFWHLDTPSESGCSGEGMEYSLSGPGCRPSFNSYMYGDAVALAAVARIAGDEVTARACIEDAHALKALVQEKLWDAKDGFYKNLPTEKAIDAHWTVGGYKAKRDRLPTFTPGCLADARELIGFVPWYFNLPEAGYESAWRLLFDEQAFFAPYGPTTSERRHRLFMRDYGHDCQWNGPSWPFATTQTLVALANLLQNYDQGVMANMHYLRLLHIYASSHQRVTEDGEPVWWIDENLDPDSGEWLARRILHQRCSDAEERGAYYNHSGFCDLVISGLCGLIPSADDVFDIRPLIPEGTWNWFCLDGVRYHDHELTILYDRDGSRYGCGKGLRIMVDGSEAAGASELQWLRVSL